MLNAPFTFLDATHVRLAGRRLLYFAGCNYLGLSWHSAVRRALARAAEGPMLQPGASRATTGEQTCYRQFERRLARVFSVENTAYVTSGYLAPIAACQSLRESVTHVLLDDHAHPCVSDGAVLTGKIVNRFPHADPGALRAAVRSLPRNARPLVACDGTYGIRGGVTPLDAYLDALPRRGFLLVDDAHGAGTVGPRGRGIVELFGLCDPRIIQTISLAKAFGVSGGAVLGSHERIVAVREKAAGFIGTTSPLRPVIAALEASLRIFQKHPQLFARLQSNVALLNHLLPGRAAIIGDPRTPVVGVFPTSLAQAEALRTALLRAEIFPPFIRYVTGPGTGFFRFALSALHTPAEIRLLARTIAGSLRTPDLAPKRFAALKKSDIGRSRTRDKRIGTR